MEKSTLAHWKELVTSTQGQKWVSNLRIVLVVGIVAYLVYRVSSIGWGEVWTSRPQSPAFYLLLLGMYALLPLCEGFIYGRLWHLSLGDTVLALLRKRVLNSDVLNYAGEVPFYMWAKQRTGYSGRRILSEMKDNMIVSSVVSVLAAVLLLTLLIGTGLIDPQQFTDRIEVLYLVGGGVMVALLIGTLGRVRRFLFALPARVLGMIFLAHLARYGVGWGLQLTAWTVAIPAATAHDWALLLAVHVLVNRIPLLPSKDLIFVGAGLGVSSLLSVPVANIAGLLIVQMACFKLLNVVMFALTTFWRRHDSDPAMA